MCGVFTVFMYSFVWVFLFFCVFFCVFFFSCCVSLLLLLRTGGLTWSVPPRLITAGYSRDCDFLRGEDFDR
jgi:hypothetical protein